MPRGGVEDSAGPSPRPAKGKAKAPAPSDPKGPDPVNNNGGPGRPPSLEELERLRREVAEEKRLREQLQAEMAAKEREAAAERAVRGRELVPVGHVSPGKAPGPLASSSRASASMSRPKFSVFR